MDGYLGASLEDLYGQRKPIATVLRERAAATPDKDFIRVGDAPWMTYHELDERTDRLAAGFAALGVCKGDRIAVMCDNRIEATELVFVCAKLGAIEVPLNYHLRGDFLKYQLAGCDATILVADEQGLAICRPLLDETSISTIVLLDGSEEHGTVSYDGLRSTETPPPEVEVTLEDLQCILYTSGTTGMPKGCTMSHGYYGAIAVTLREAGFIVDGDRMSSATPHFHMSFQNGVLVTALMNGAQVYQQPVFSASKFMAQCRAEHITMIWGLGPMAVAILAQPETPHDFVPTLRFSEWVPLRPDMQLEFERRFGGRVSCQIYGQSEASFTSIGRADDPSPDRMTAGWPGQTPFDVRVVDENDRDVPVDSPGEIVVRPRITLGMYSGYWNNAEASWKAARNMWHHTGDVGKLDQEGRLTFVDRAKDALRRRGENVSCVELELAIMGHDAVSAVAITGVPSPMGDDDIKASIVPAGEFDVDRFFEFLKVTVPYFAIPRYVDLRNQLPLTASGRVRKDVLRAEGLTGAMLDLEAMGLTVARADRRSDTPGRGGGKISKI